MVTSPEWRKHLYKTKYSALGGVTDGSATITYAARRTSWQEIHTDLAQELERREWPKHDVLSAVDDVVRGKTVGGPPTRQGSVIVQRMALEDAWSGTGLLPLKAGPAAEFVVPSVMSPTKWCKRALSVTERWKAHDVPEEVIGAIGKDCLMLLNRFLAPGRCYEEGARVLLQDHMVLDGEGNACVAALENQPIHTVCHGPRGVEMRSLVGRLDDDLPSSREFNPYPTRRAYEMEGMRESARSETRHTFVPRLATVLEEENAAYDEAVRSGKHDEMPDFDKEARDLKATKADDAPIPEYLWDDAAMIAGNLPRSRATQRPSVQSTTTRHVAVLEAETYREIRWVVEIS